MRKHRDVRVGTILALLLTTLFVTAPDAGASFHLNKIVEVFAGDSTSPDAHYVEIKMFSGGQNFVSGQRLRVFNPDGTEAGTVTFDGNVSSGASQSSILVASAQAEDYFGIQADFDLTVPLDPAGGAVCFATIDCVAWGTYVGDTSATGSPFQPEAGLTDGMAMTRDVSGGSRANLDAGDDTNDSAADFDAAAPAPTNNAGQTGVPGGGPPSPPDDTTPPTSSVVKPADSVVYRRVRVANGLASDDNAVALVQVALSQKRKNGSCKWWDGTSFVKRACSSKVFVDAFSTQSWTLTMPRMRSSMTRRSKIKYYMIYSRATDEAGNVESTFDRARNANRFEVR